MHNCKIQISKHLKNQHDLISNRLGSLHFLLQNVSEDHGVYFDIYGRNIPKMQSCKPWAKALASANILVFTPKKSTFAHTRSPLQPLTMLPPPLRPGLPLEHPLEFSYVPHNNFLPFSNKKFRPRKIRATQTNSLQHANITLSFLLS